MENYLPTDKLIDVNAILFSLMTFNERRTSGFFEIRLLLCLDQF